MEHTLNPPARLQDQAPLRFQDDRERRVLLGIVDGLTNEKIGENIGMSESAVKNVVQRLFSMTAVRRRSQLVRATLEGSLVTMDELGSYRTGRTADASSSHSEKAHQRGVNVPSTNETHGNKTVGWRDWPKGLMIFVTRGCSRP